MEEREEQGKSEGGGLRADASPFLSPHPPPLHSAFLTRQHPQAAAGPLLPQQPQASVEQAVSCNVDKCYSGEAARRQMVLHPLRGHENHHTTNTQEALDSHRLAEPRVEYHSSHWGPPGPPSLHVGGGGWVGPPCYRVEGPGRHPSDLASRLSACRGGEATEEEEKDEPDSDSEEEEHRCIPALCRTWFRAFFPNTPPFVWFFLQFFVCFLLLLMGLESVSASKPDFFLARAPADWAPTSPDAKPPLEVVRADAAESLPPAASKQCTDACARRHKGITFSEY
ncbi:hypothetical protein Esti_006620 [Eimeria stiedai]